MNLLKLYSDSFHDNWNEPALTDYSTRKTITYGELAACIASTHIFFKGCGVKPGDKIALEGSNSIAWVTIYMATITYGAIIVPLSGKYERREAIDILNHSDAVMLFVSEDYMPSYDFDALPQLHIVASLDRKAIIAQRDGDPIDAAKVLENIDSQFHKMYASGFGPKDIRYTPLEPDSIVCIDYTSGTTGSPKGAMITQDNIEGNVIFGIQSRIHRPRSRCLSYLPLSHAYGCTFDMLVPLATGSHITLFDHALTLSALSKALKEVRPYTILFVPASFERLFVNTLQPFISNSIWRRLLKSPILNRLSYRIMRHRLNKALGGKFREAVIGGAPLNTKIEDLLIRMGFRYTIGYGMIECAPLISYTSHEHYKPRSCGLTLKTMKAKIIGEPDKPGEICVKGMNLMKGYYKNPEATRMAIDSDGWFHTGDIGTIDTDGTIRLSGRISTVIEVAGRHMIYPEKIELQLHSIPTIAEALIVQRNGKLTALVRPDYETIEHMGVPRESAHLIIKDNITELNRLLPLYERIEEIEIRDQEFTKTTKFTIKRHLYS